MQPQYIPYLRHPRVDITIVVDGGFATLAPRHPNEVLLVRDPWYPAIAEVAVRKHRKRQAPTFDRLYFLSNTEEIHRCRIDHGFNSHFINLGCFIDASTFAPVPGTPKVYDAVMNARFARYPMRELVLRSLHRARFAPSFASRARELAMLRFTTGKHREIKRHWLTERLQRLALLDPVYESDAADDKRAYQRRANCTWSNDTRLDPVEVVQIVTRAYCGLALSAVEGICRASCEYLLCGIPVVTTRSVGGRDVWYDDYNAVVVEPTVDAVHDAVAELKRSPRDPSRIRRAYLARARVFEDRFARDVLGPIFVKFDVELDPKAVVRETPFRWWL